ncbi:MAG: hypothetical protein K0S47_4220 [Herbinix sp.]|nr:hypothetical protein [Herbinix sp.]
MEVNNGGFDQYYLNTDGVYAKDTLDFLDLMGENNFSKLLNESISIFKAVIPDDRKMEEFERLDHKFYEFGSDCYDDLFEKFKIYLEHQLSVD